MNEPTILDTETLFQGVNDAINRNVSLDEFSRTAAQSYIKNLIEQGKNTDGEMYRVEHQMYRAIATSLNYRTEPALNSIAEFVITQVAAGLAGSLEVDSFATIINTAEKRNGGIVMDVMKDSFIRFKLYHGDMLAASRSFIKGAMKDISGDAKQVEFIFDKYLADAPWAEMLLMLIVLSKLNLRAVLRELMILESTA